MSVVQIDVFDPTNGPKIFDSLNSRQEPMTIGDLIRNEIFSRVANQSSEEIERLDRDRWQPFYEKFRQGDKNLFDSYFFPYGLIQNPNLAKSEVYGHLREAWREADSPDEIIDQLARYQDAFIDIVIGSNLQQHKAPLRDAIVRLNEMDAPSATYPFLMQVSQAAREGVLDEKSSIALLEVVESFLVRRAISGIEPTGLHAVFKRLWNDLSGDYSTKKLIEEIRKHITVKWPTNDEFSAEIKGRSLYGSSITPYFVAQYNRSLGGDVPHNIPWLEHILPTEPEDVWWNSFTREQHEELKDRLCNLIPLSSQMNQSLKNARYEKKRKRYLEDSMFKSARLLAKKYDDWTPKEMSSRADELATWASKRWIY